MLVRPVREHVFPALQQLVTLIKTQVVTEQETPSD